EGGRLHRGQRARRAGVARDLRPRPLPALHVGRDPLGGRRRAAHGRRRALPDAPAHRLGRGRRAHRGRGVQGGARPRVGVDHRRRPARPLAAARAPSRGHPGRAAPRVRRGGGGHLRVGRRAGRRPARARPPATLPVAAQAPGRARAAARPGGRAPGGARGRL
ncbi:MAG: hypothetical protein AVDCRST_MAG30-3053, partial [uncultured Solirubrobacteraceae bacterium]